jgi:hypothetical protein
VVNIAHDGIYHGLPVLYKALCSDRRADYIREINHVD